jgi:shikimate dehydrogenase
MISKISASTQICGLIGDPVEHSLSPAMHNAAFKKTGLNFVYLPFKVTAKNLPGAITGLRSLNFRGLNVTIPHKVAVIPLLDELDPAAKQIGAINTIVNDNGHLKGYNTDAAGFLKSLSVKDINPTGKRVVILGAGGVSRAITFSLVEQGAEITILNRSQKPEWVEKLAINTPLSSTNRVQVMELNDANLQSALKHTDILINATSVGMNPDVGKSLVPQELFRPEMVVFDVIYNPEKTRLLADADKAGATTIGGLDMLVWQGALAFELWTGIKAPVEAMKKAAVNILSAQA